MTRACGKAFFGLTASVVLAVALAGCGGSAPAGNGAAGGGTAPTTLPKGATLGCAEAPSSGCVYGGLTTAPSGLKVENIDTKIMAGLFALESPMALVTDKGAPGGSYLSIPTGAGSTSSVVGDAAVAVNIPSDGYYVVFAGTQSGDTTTGTDSFFVSMDGSVPTADADHLWSINPDNTWHLNDSAGGCIQIVHSGANDAPAGCDTWHFKKGILVIHVGGRENNSHLAYLDVVPANPAKPMGDSRQ